MTQFRNTWANVSVEDVFVHTEVARGILETDEPRKKLRRGRGRFTAAELAALMFLLVCAHRLHASEPLDDVIWRLGPQWTEATKALARSALKRDFA
jgi:hypothetical protein